MKQGQRLFQFPQNSLSEWVSCAPDCCSISPAQPGVHTVPGLAFDRTGCRTLVSPVNPAPLFLRVRHPWGNLCPNNLRFPEERELPALLSS